MSSSRFLSGRLDARCAVRERLISVKFYKPGITAYFRELFEVKTSALTTGNRRPLAECQKRLSFSTFEKTL